MTRLVAGVDSSTQSTKVELREHDSGSLVARTSAPHPPTAPPVSEQDPRRWWEALTECFADLGAQARDVAAISVAGQQHGLVVLDETGAPLRPAKLWNDTTSAGHAAGLVERHGATNWAAGCGSVPVASFTIAKLAWLIEHEPEVAERIARVMLPHDYLTWRLTGHHVTDRGDASGTGWFSPADGTYVREHLGLVVDDPARWLDRLPQVLRPDEPAGTIDPEAAEALGLSPEVVVAAGTGDNMGAALGLGLRSGDVAMSLGTSGTVYAVAERPTADPTGAVAGFADATGRYLPLVCTLNATKVTDTVARWLGTDAAGLSDLALSAVPRDDGPVLVPYFDGERTPNLPDASGSLTGLRNDTEPADLALAAHDGVLCGLFDGLDALDTAGVSTDGVLHLIGGGARSAAYRRRAADLRGAPIVVPDTDETVATGAAVQAAVASGAGSFADIAGQWRLGEGELIEPTHTETGRRIRERYRHACDAAGPPLG